MMRNDELLDYVYDYMNSNNKVIELLNLKILELERKIPDTMSDEATSTKVAYEKDKEFTFGIHNSFINQRLSVVVQEDQIDILQEECAELIQACSKFLRDKPTGFASLKEEMTHVLLSSAMVAKILGITQNDIDLEVEKKACKLLSPGFVEEKPINRSILFAKYKERARLAYNVCKI